MSTETKTNSGNFFEDFKVGQFITHATPRTITAGDVALYNALYSARFAIQSSDTFAANVGYPCAPVDDLLVFHVVFGKTVPDISLNAIANLGYAECIFENAVYPGDTLTATSKIIGLKENTNGETGVVYVRTAGHNQRGEAVLNYVRWVMVRKRDKASPAPTPSVPSLNAAVPSENLGRAIPHLAQSRYDTTLSGASHRWGDYAIGEKIDHVDGTTIEEAEHQLATRLYQNTAKVHFDAHAARSTRFGRRLIYGGVAISLARALSFNGLANAFHIAAINAGRHVSPLFAGDTVYAWTEVIGKAACANRNDIALLRLRTIAAKNQPCTAFPCETVPGTYDSSVILDLDYWAALPK